MWWTRYAGGGDVGDAPRVTVERLYQVECDNCGVIIAETYRDDADKAAKDHRRAHREEATHAETPDWGAPPGPVPDLMGRLRESVDAAKARRERLTAAEEATRDV